MTIMLMTQTAVDQSNPTTRHKINKTTKSVHTQQDMLTLISLALELDMTTHFVHL